MAYDKVVDSARLDSQLTALANAIREKTDKTEKLALDAMPAAVGEVYKAGAKEGNEAFWEAYQQNGARTNFAYAFAGIGWNNDTLHPKYPLFPTWALYMFYNCQFVGDIAEIGVSLDLSRNTEADAIFRVSSFTRLGVLDFSKVANLNYCLQQCTNLETVEKIILKADGSQRFSTTFSNCPALKNIRFEGVIGQNGLDFSQSPLLTHESIMSVIGCLKDYSGTGGAYTLTLGEANLAKLTDTEKAAATEKGWTLA